MRRTEIMIIQYRSTRIVERQHSSAIVVNAEANEISNDTSDDPGIVARSRDLFTASDPRSSFWIKLINRFFNR